MANPFAEIENKTLTETSPQKNPFAEIEKEGLPASSTNPFAEIEKGGLSTKAFPTQKPTMFERVQQKLGAIKEAIPEAADRLAAFTAPLKTVPVLSSIASVAESGAAILGEEKDVSPGAVSAAAFATGTIGMAESIFRTPEALKRFIKFADVKLGARKGAFEETGAGEAMKWVAKYSNEIADSIKSAREMLSSPVLEETALGKPFVEVSKINQKADVATNKLFEGDVAPLLGLLGDTKTWGAFVGQAAPSMVAAIMSGGSLKFISWLEGMEFASDTADFEKRTGQKISDEEFVKGITQVAFVNGLLERLGIRKITKGAGREAVRKFLNSSIGKKAWMTVANGLTKGLWEGTTEALQQVNTNIAEFIRVQGKKLTELTPKVLSKGVLASTIGGFGAGVGVSGATDVTQVAKAGPTKPTGKAEAKQKEAQQEADLVRTTDQILKGKETITEQETTTTKVEPTQDVDIQADKLVGREFSVGDAKYTIKEVKETTAIGERIDEGTGKGTRVNFDTGYVQQEISKQEMPTKTEALPAKKGIIRTAPTTDIQASREVSALPGKAYVGMLDSAVLPQESITDAIPIRRDQIVKNFAKKMGVKVYTGRTGKSRLGFFREVSEEVRIKHHNDLEVLAHEVAHFVDKKFPEFQKAYKKPAFAKELSGVSYDAKKLNEGFAEFVRLYMTQEAEAQRAAPQFYEWFTQTLSGHVIESAIVEAQEGMTAWYNQGALLRAKSKIGPPAPTWQEKIRGYSEGLGEKLMVRVFDSLRQVKIAEIDLLGDVQDATTSAYKMLRLIPGIKGMTKAVFERGTIGWTKEGNIEFTGPSLKSVFEPVSSKMEDALTYFVGKRAQELLPQGRERLFKEDEIKAMVAFGKDPDILQAHKNLMSFNKRMMDFYQQSGLLSAETREIIEEANKNYVPFNRLRELADGTLKKGSTKTFMTLRGGTQNLNNIMENIATNVASMIEASVVNRAKNKTYSMLDKADGGSRYAVKIGPDARLVNIDIEQIQRKMKAAGIKMDGAFDMEKLGDFMSFFTFGNPPMGANIDSVMRNGKRIYYEISDPLFIDAMQTFGTRQTVLALKIGAGFKSLLTRGVTLAPSFLIPNLVRDSFNAVVLSKSGMKPLIDSTIGMVNRMRSDKVYWEYMANGGGFVSTAEVEGAPLRRKLEKFYTSHGIDYQTVKDTPAKLLDFYDQFASSFEYGTRLAEFKKLRKKGVSPREATFQGREISTDFAMRGSSETMRWLSMLVPFFNARIQGLYRDARGMHEDPVGFSIKATLAITIPTLILYFYNKDDEEYKALEDWDKDLHWMINRKLWGGEGFIRIPKPFEIGAMFATVPERTMEFFEKRDGKLAMDRFRFMFFEAMSLNPTPQFYKPISEVLKNKKFTGGPIVPFDLQDVEPGEQFRPWTSVTMRVLGKGLGVSPMKLEHLWRGYTGTLGMNALMASDAFVRDSLGEDAPTMRMDEMPVLRRFLRNPPYRGTSYATNFYKLATESRTAVATFNKIMRENRPEDAEKYAKDKEIAIALDTSIKSIRKNMGLINREMMSIRTDKGLTPDQKRVKIDDLIREKNQLMREALSQLTEAKYQKLRDDMGKL